MKIKLYLKDPDGVYDSLQEAVYREVAAIPNLDDDERETVEEIKMNKVTELISKWVGDMKYVSIEIDTDTNTATVLPRK